MYRELLTVVSADIDYIKQAVLWHANIIEMVPEHHKIAVGENTENLINPTRILGRTPPRE